MAAVTEAIKDSRHQVLNLSFATNMLCDLGWGNFHILIYEMGTRASVPAANGSAVVQMRNCTLESRVLCEAKAVWFQWWWPWGEPQQTRGCQKLPAIEFQLRNSGQAKQVRGRQEFHGVVQRHLASNRTEHQPENHSPLPLESGTMASAPWKPKS